MTEFCQPDEYPWLCDECKKTLAQITQLFEEDMMPDTDDIEAPSMHMYDNGLYCGGHTCANPPAAA